MTRARRTSPRLMVDRALAVMSLLCLMFGCGSSEVELIDDGFEQDGGAGPNAPALPGLLSLRIEPQAQETTDDGEAPPEEVRYKAYGKFANGERDVTKRVGWSLRDARLGAASSGRVSTAGIAGKTQVRVTAGDVAADADLTVRLDMIVVADDDARDAPGLFPEGTNDDVVGGAQAPIVSYPAGDTMFPRNLTRVLHQWRAAAGLDVFEARFESRLARLRVFTTRRSFAPDLRGWRALAESHAGSSLTFSVRGLARAQPDQTYASRPITLHYAQSEVLGALYYWSTSAQGILRANISAPSASKFFPDPAAADVTCAACHAVARNGRRLAVGYGGETLRQVSLPERRLEIPSAETDPMMPMPGPMMPGPMPEPMPGKVPYGWGTYNPEATRLLIASKGALTLLNAENAKELRKLKLPKDVVATHPDWSPDGKWIAVTLGTGKLNDKDVKGTSLARIAVKEGDDFGKPETLLTSSGNEDTVYFPMYSPDSKFLAFVRTQGKSKDSASAQLFLLAADGSAGPFALPRLNQSVGPRSDLTSIGNAMPTWAPSSEPGVFWLAFSSMRDYGDLLVGARRDQLWAAAVDTSAIEPGQDPSYSAFWLPFQQLEECNHRAFWALDPDEACPSTVEVCDNVDNDCDGVVDESCCTPQVEVCGNVSDDDCDGTIDDGCGCSASEDCDNGTDDDCDGLSDLADEDCVLVE